MTDSNERSINSILAADFGSVNTRVTLFDKVDGQFRLVSRAQTLTTAAPPIGDITIGLHRVLEEMGSLLGRPLSDSHELIRGEQADGSGTDMFVTTVSGARPMRTVLVGLMPEISLRSGQRALGTSYIEVVDTLSLTDARTMDEQVNALLAHNPDLIFIVGGTDFGAKAAVESLLRVVRLSLLMRRSTHPVVLYAGNEALRSVVNAQLADECQLFMTTNVRPELGQENISPIELELALVYGAHVASNVGGFAELQTASSMGILATSQAYLNIVRYLADLPGVSGSVVCVDVGSSTSTLVLAVGQQSYTDIRTDLGIGHSIKDAVKVLDTDHIVRWLTFDTNAKELSNYALNKALRPSSVPQTPHDLEIEYAIAREAIRQMVEDAQPWLLKNLHGKLTNIRHLIGTGSILAQAINPGIGALLLLDAFRPVGITRLQLDPYGIIPAMGGACYLEPLATVQVMESGGLLELGTAICLAGKAPNGVAADVSVKLDSGRTIQTQIQGGQIATIPIPIGQKAQVTIKLGRGLTINGKRNLNASIEGGVVGLIIDARGRPFHVPHEMKQRAQVLPQWYRSMVGGAS